MKKVICEDRTFKSTKEKIRKNFCYPEIRLVSLYRKAQYYTKCKNPITRAYWSLRWLYIRKKYGMQISLDAKIGKGLRLLHDGVRIVVKAATLGEQCVLGVNVVIGYGYNQDGWNAPTLGDRVYVGHNSSLVGDIVIGDDVLIAPNAYVNKDVPSHSVVIGNNVIIPKENASAPFLTIGP